MTGLQQLRARLMRDARQFAKAGNDILVREGRIEPTSLRTAANQFRQAAITLDQLDGVEQAVHFAKPDHTV